MVDIFISWQRSSQMSQKQELLNENAWLLLQLWLLAVLQGVRFAQTTNFPVVLNTKRQKRGFFFNGYIVDVTLVDLLCVKKLAAGLFSGTQNCLEHIIGCFHYGTGSNKWSTLFSKKHNAGPNKVQTTRGPKTMTTFLLIGCSRIALRRRMVDRNIYLFCYAKKASAERRLFKCFSWHTSIGFYSR